MFDENTNSFYVQFMKKSMYDKYLEYLVHPCRNTRSACSKTYNKTYIPSPLSKCTNVYDVFMMNQINLFNNNFNVVSNNNMELDNLNDLEDIDGFIKKVHAIDSSYYEIYRKFYDDYFD